MGTLITGRIRWAPSHSAGARRAAGSGSRHPGVAALCTPLVWWYSSIGTREPSAVARAALAAAAPDRRAPSSPCQRREVRHSASVAPTDSGAPGVCSGRSAPAGDGRVGAATQCCGCRTRNDHRTPNVLWSPALPHRSIAPVSRRPESPGRAAPPRESLASGSSYGAGRARALTRRGVRVC